MSPVESGIRGMDFKARAPRLGKVRLGIMVVNRASEAKPERERTDRDYHPQRVDYFVTDDDDHGRALRDFLAQGSEPRTIPIAFVSDDPAEVAPFNLELYGNGSRKCIGNGELAEGVVNLPVLGAWRAAIDEWKATGSDEEPPLRWTFPAPPPNLWASGRPDRDAPEPERRRFPCLGAGYEGAPACPMFVTSGEGCSATMHFTFAVRGFPALGTWEITTGSTMNIERVTGFLAFLKATAGRLTQVPILLDLEPVTIRGQKYHALRFNLDVTEGFLLPGMRPVPALAPPADTLQVDDDRDEPIDAVGASSAVAEDDPAVGAAEEPPAAQMPLGAPAAEVLVEDTHPSVCPIDKAVLEAAPANGAWAGQWGHRVGNGRAQRIHMLKPNDEGLWMPAIYLPNGEPVA